VYVRTGWAGMYFQKGKKKEGGHPIDLSGFSNSIIPQAEISEAVSIGS